MVEIEAEAEAEAMGYVKEKKVLIGVTVVLVIALVVPIFISSLISSIKEEAEHIHGVIIQRNPPHSKLTHLSLFDWPTWEGSPSKFPWTFTATETMYFREGRVKVYCEGHEEEPFEIGAGDFVVFPKGMKVTWDITHAVKKHYHLDNHDPVASFDSPVTVPLCSAVSGSVSDPPYLNSLQQPCYGPSQQLVIRPITLSTQLVLRSPFQPNWESLSLLGPHLNMELLLAIDNSCYNFDLIVGKVKRSASRRFCRVLGTVAILCSAKLLSIERC